MSDKPRMLMKLKHQQMIHSDLMIITYTLNKLQSYSIYLYNSLKDVINVINLQKNLLLSSLLTLGSVCTLS